VDDAFGVGGVEGVCNFDGEIDQRFGVDGTASDAVLEGLAFEELHDDEGLAVFLVNFVDGADVGMVQGRSGASFPLKTIKGLTILGEFFRKKFEGDEASELDVLGAVDDAHAAAAQLFDDAVVRDGLADHLVGIVAINESGMLGERLS
jgi:hypothetical protein